MDVISAFTWSGVRSGRCWRSSAAAPETTAAACEVPLPRKNRSPTRAAGWSTSMREPGSRRLMTDVPGATRSGRRAASPRLDQAATTSSSPETVPRESPPATAIT